VVAEQLRLQELEEEYTVDPGDAELERNVEELFVWAIPVHLGVVQIPEAVALH